MNRTSWPAALTSCTDEVEKGHFKDAVVYNKRAGSAVFNRGISADRFYGDDKAATGIRRVLGLAPAGMGCGEY